MYEIEKKGERKRKKDGIVASYGPVIHDEEKKIVKAIQPIRSKDSTVCTVVYIHYYRVSVPIRLSYFFFII